MKWCGRIISEEGIKHDPARITALTELPEPKTAKELQQLPCAVIWMHTSIPGYNVIVAPLMPYMIRQAGEPSLRSPEAIWPKWVGALPSVRVGRIAKEL